jgi:hypothetical protein
MRTEQVSDKVPIDCQLWVNESHIPIAAGELCKKVER